FFEESTRSPLSPFPFQDTTFETVTAGRKYMRHVAYPVPSAPLSYSSDKPR
ncbi:hypothetical protein COCCADRAFT_112105, partial [Bipolaris zeicola 26-R-13]